MLHIYIKTNEQVLVDIPVEAAVEADTEMSDNRTRSRHPAGNYVHTLRDQEVVFRNSLRSEITIYS